MSVEQFKAAAEALKDFPSKSPAEAEGRTKVVGMIGGEPLVHPQFRELCDLLHAAIPARDQCGLWTGLDVTKSVHYDAIRRTFGHANYNNHAKYPSLHQPVLVAIKDAIPDAEKMWELIGKCWVQEKWSATINPRGFYFCEVAAALANILGGPDGLPVEPGCWKRPLKDFRKQIEWACPRCGCALPLQRRADKDRLDDVSPSNMEALKAAGSPAIERCRILDTTAYNLAESREKWNPRIYREEGPSPWIRIAPPSPLESMPAFTVCVGYDDILAITLPRMVKTFRQVFVISAPQDAATAALAKQAGATLYVTDAFYRQGAAFNKGLAIEEAMQLIVRKGWIATIDADILLPGKFPEFGIECGNLYSAPRRVCDDLSQWQPGTKWSQYRQWGEVEYSGYLHIFHAADPVLKTLPWYGLDWRHAGGYDSEFQSRWDAGHKKVLPWECLHIGPVDTNWLGRISPRLDAADLVIPPEQHAAMFDTLRTYRDKQHQQAHRLVDPDEAIQAALAALCSDPKKLSKAQRRLRHCNSCHYFRGDWCWDSHGDGTARERFAKRLLFGSCHGRTPIEEEQQGLHNG
jgi:hypothetical protein